MLAFLYHRGENIMNKYLGYIMILGLMINGMGCGDDDSNPTSSSVSQDSYSETIVGGWKIEGQLALTFNANGTVVYDGWEEYNYTWKIEGARLTITDADSGEVFSQYDIKSLSSTELVTVDPEYPDYENRYVR